MAQFLSLFCRVAAGREEIILRAAHRLKGNSSALRDRAASLNFTAGAECVTI
jgi:hypothetical protein